NLAAALARRGRRTLLMDLDPQSHCAVGLAVPEEAIDLQSGDALLHAGRAIDLSRLVWTVARNLDLIPSTTKLAGVEAARGGLADRDDREARLAVFLASVDSRYDYALIDCPPSIGLLTFNALRAAGEVLIPVETAFFALQGAAKQIATLRAVCRRFGTQAGFRVVATMH
ncbi:MAG TPA: chromosome partitioning protein ParA, partial [Phycisphaerales bacterium]|nr:chromosome partitioning protein ParA [Phycisphaerales bacterium]